VPLDVRIDAAKAAIQYEKAPPQSDDGKGLSLRDLDFKTMTSDQ